MVWHTITGLPLRQALVSVLVSAALLDLNKSKYHYVFLKKHTVLGKADSAHINIVDATYTDAAIKLLLDIFAGDITGYLSYDEVSPKYAEKDKAFILGRLSAIKNGDSLRALGDSLQPTFGQYTNIKNNLAKALR